MTGTTRSRTDLKDARTKGFLGPGTIATIIAMLLFSILGRRKRAIKQNFATRAFGLLDPGQRQVALQLWHASRIPRSTGGRATSSQ